jgi:hypothetical protein
MLTENEWQTVNLKPKLDSNSYSNFNSLRASGKLPTNICKDLAYQGFPGNSVQRQTRSNPGSQGAQWDREDGYGHLCSRGGMALILMAGDEDTHGGSPSQCGFLAGSKSDKRP